MPALLAGGPTDVVTGWRWHLEESLAAPEVGALGRMVDCSAESPVGVSPGADRAALAGIDRFEPGRKQATECFFDYGVSMSDYVAVSRKHHADNGWLPRERYSFTAGQPVASILIAEISRLLPYYLLGFVEQGDGFEAVALLGLSNEQNLYLHPDGRWLADYVPASLRGYPFDLKMAGGDKQVLCLERGSMTDGGQGEPLFDEGGELAGRVRQTMNFLQQRDRQHQTTRQATRLLQEAGLIKPWALQIERGEGHAPYKVEGLHYIDEKALNALPPDAFAALRKQGALALAFGQLFSTTQVDKLAERAEFQARFQPAPVDDSYDRLFDGDDDELTFDFGD
ncbi:MAG: SapC family protein [Pseudomonadota bacterium]|nr:SapC family protein [Pseudomonadota bacterium]